MTHIKRLLRLLSAAGMSFAFAIFILGPLPFRNYDIKDLIALSITIFTTFGMSILSGERQYSVIKFPVIACSIAIFTIFISETNLGQLMPEHDILSQLFEADGERALSARTAEIRYQWWVVIFMILWVCKLLWVRTQSFWK
jgi:hypothetical protein